MVKNPTHLRNLWIKNGARQGNAVVSAAMKQTYFHGQRWISETEPELGLGLVADVTPRTVQVFYHAANEMRHYAIGNAPLKRVRFSTGDEITSREGAQLTVETVIENDATGLLSYEATDGARLEETDLCDTSSFDRPETRLLGGHVDAITELDDTLAAARLITAS